MSILLIESSDSLDYDCWTLASLRESRVSHHCRAEKRNCFLHILVFQIRSTILLYWSCWYWERFRFTAWCSLICVEDKISNDEEALMVLQTRGNPSQRCLSARNMKLVESCNGGMPVYINSLKLFVSFSLSSCWSFWDLIVLRFVWGMQLLNVQRYVPAFVLEGPLLFFEKKTRWYLDDSYLSLLVPGPSPKWAF